VARNEVDIVIRAVDEASRALDSAKRDLDQLTESANRATTAGKRLRKAYENAVGPSRVVMGAFVGVGTAALGAAGYMINLAGQMEQTEIAFTTMLGNAEEAKAFMVELSDLAGTTPFQLPGLQQAARLLLAFGIEAEAAIPMVTTLGDTVSALGGGDEELQGVIRAIGQIQAKGKVSAEELLQLAERGVPAYQILQEELGLTGEEVANIGTLGIDASTGINALLTGLGERFGGAMEAQSKTILGLFSNVQDEVTRISTIIGGQLTEALGLDEALQSGITALGEFRGRLEEVGLKGVLEGISEQAIITAGALTGAMLPAIINLAIMVGRATLRLSPWIVAGAVAARTAQALGVELDDARPAINRFALALQGVGEIVLGLVDGIAYFISATLDRFVGMINFVDDVQGIMADLQLAVESGSMGARDAVQALTDYMAVSWDREFDGLPDSIHRMLQSSEDRLRAGAENLATALAGTPEEVATAAEPAAAVLDDIADSVADVTDQLTSPLDTSGLEDVETELRDIETAANDVGAALRNAWGMPDAARRGALAGDARDISQDTDEAQRRRLPVPVPMTVEADDKTLAVLDYLAGQPDAFSDRTTNLPVRLDWLERADQAMIDELFEGGRLGGTTDNLYRISVAFTAAELKDQAWMDALMSGGGASDRLDALPVPLTWRAELDEVIFDALGDYDPKARTGTQYGTGGVMTGETSAERQRARQDTVIDAAMGDYDPKLRTGSQYGERGSRVEREPEEEGPGALSTALTSAADAAVLFGTNALAAAQEAVPALDAAITGFATGGPLGALTAVLGDALQSSEAFTGIMEALNRVTEPLVEAMTTVLDAIWPIIDVAIALVEGALQPIIWILENVVAPVFTAVAKVVAGIWNAIANAINWALGWLGVNLRTIDIPEGGSRAPRPGEEPEDRDTRPSWTRDDEDSTSATVSSAPPAAQFAAFTPLVGAAYDLAEAAALLVNAAEQRATTLSMDRFTTALDRATPVLDRLADGIPIRIEGGSTVRSPDRMTALR